MATQNVVQPVLPAAASQPSLNRKATFMTNGSRTTKKQPVKYPLKRSKTLESDPDYTKSRLIYLRDIRDHRKEQKRIRYCAHVKGGLVVVAIVCTSVSTMLSVVNDKFSDYLGDATTRSIGWTITALNCVAGILNALAAINWAHLYVNDDRVTLQALHDIVLEAIMPEVLIEDGSEKKGETEEKKLALKNNPWLKIRQVGDELTEQLTRTPTHVRTGSGKSKRMGPQSRTSTVAQSGSSRHVGLANTLRRFS